MRSVPASGPWPEAWSQDRVESHGRYLPDAVEQGPSDFTAFLGRLQALIGTSVTVEVGIENRFFGVQFNAELERVETLEGSDVVTVHFSNGATVDLAPDEQTVHHIGPVVELRLGPEVSLEIRPEPGP
jgi:hypothetical protein